MEQLVLDMGLAPVPTLANFVSEGHEALLQHLSAGLHPGAPEARVPTYLWGPEGSGKSHLLQAVAQQAQQAGLGVGWIHARSPAPPAFDERWSVLLLDDCDRYTPHQQAMAFNWFVNALAPTQGPPRWVLAAGTCPVTDLPLREDLRTRLGWGYVFQLRALTESGRRQVLRRAAAQRGFALSEDTVDFMLNRFSRDLSSLMCLLDQLDGFAMRTQRAITVPLIRAMLESE